MNGVGRRSVIRGSLGLAAAGALARPYIANAAAKTATVWWAQGFVPEEDASFKQMVADYEKASGNKIDYSILPFVALGQKMVSALQTGDTPDVISYDGIQTTLVLNAWNGKLVDVSDVVATQEAHFTSTALLSTKLYNKTENRRAFYAVPYKCASEPFHVWSDLVEKAGYKMSDIPNTWDKRWDFFKPMQAKLRAQGMRSVYAFGLQMTTNGPSDGNNVFHGFLIANGGKGLVTPDGKIHLDDPQVKEAVIKTISYITSAYKQNYTPPGAISWNDADDNNGFHSKLFVMDFDGTLSTELAMIHRPKDYNACVTLGLPLGNDGKPIAGHGRRDRRLDPQGREEHRGRQGLHAIVIRPEVNNEYLKAGLGRWVPVFPELTQTDPFWLHHKDPHRAPYIEETLTRSVDTPTTSPITPAYAEVEAQQVWGQSYADGVQGRHDAGQPRRTMRSSKSRQFSPNTRSPRRGERHGWQQRPNSSGSAADRWTARVPVCLAGRPARAGADLGTRLPGTVFRDLPALSSSIRLPTGCGWAATQPSTPSCSRIRSTRTTVVNTLIYVMVGVNLRMVMALGLSGFFMRRELVGQGAADGLHPALGGAGAAHLPVDPLDAERRLGAAQQPDLGRVPL